MAELSWQQLPGGSEMASKGGWTYLITRDAGFLVLTRWEPRAMKLSWEVARQAARHAIVLGGPWDLMPDAAERSIAHLKVMAQQYASGLSVDGRPAWRHGPPDPGTACQDSEETRS